MNIYMSKEERNSFIGMKDEKLTIEQIEYATGDIKHLIPLKYNIEEEARNKKTKVLDLENAMSLVIADMEYEGIKFDVDKWKELASIATTQRELAHKALDDEIESDKRFKKYKAKYYQTNMFVPDDEIRKIEVNWASPKQVLDVVRKVDSKIQSVEAKELKEHEGKHPIISKILDFSEWGKKCTTYGMEFLNHIHPDGRIRTRFFPIVSTGRLSSRDPNMQNIPADTKYRNCFLPNYDGWVFVSGDFSAQELAIIAWGAQDSVWLQALEEGKDLHSICAALLFGDKWRESAEPDCRFYEEQNNQAINQKCNCPKHKKLRDIVKTLNFGLAYGLSAHSFSSRMGISIHNAEKIIDDYFTAFPKIKYFLESLSHFAKTKGFMVTMRPFFRLRKFKDWKGSYTEDSVLSSIERMGRNSHVQGTAADMIKLALALTRKYLNDNDLRDKVKIVLTVHDEINTITTKEFSDTWKLKLKEIMEKAAQVIVPSNLIRVEPTISLQWEK
jgi:DNA polymerase-1